VYSNGALNPQIPNLYSPDFLVDREREATALQLYTDFASGTVGQSRTGQAADRASARELQRTGRRRRDGLRGRRFGRVGGAAVARRRIGLAAATPVGGACMVGDVSQGASGALWQGGDEGGGGEGEEGKEQVGVRRGEEEGGGEDGADTSAARPPSDGRVAAGGGEDLCGDNVPVVRRYGVG
jgi:hypothetical protein